jgi:hypothetical protein
MIIVRRLVPLLMLVAVALCVAAVGARSGNLPSNGSHLLFAGNPALAPDSEISLVEIGRSGVVFQRGHQEAELIAALLEESQLTVESDAGRMFVTAQLRNSSGQAAALVRNELSGPSSPSSWDRNYTDDALEVIGPDGRVMLQIRVLPDRIQIQGEWWDEGGSGIRIGTKGKDRSAFITRLSREQNPDQPMIEPMFR